MAPWDLIERTRDFALAVIVAFEEADECVDWLEYLKDGRIQQNMALLQEARELASILGRAVQTAGRRSPVE